MRELKLFFIFAVSGWTLLVAVLGINHASEMKGGITQLVLQEARTAFEMNRLYFLWNSDHGGVYVPTTPNHPPNPHLDAPEKDIRTPSGKPLTLTNSAYMIREVNRSASKESQYKMSLVSLTPINPLNTPDEWERNALKDFSHGATQKYAFDKTGGESRFRLIRPIVIRRNCLSCHANSGYSVGEVRGGISVTIPAANHEAIVNNELVHLGLTDLAIWGFGVLGIAFMFQNIMKKERLRKTAEDALSESHRTIEAKVAERTSELKAEITLRKTAEKRLERSNRTLNLIRRCHRAMVQANEEKAFLEETCAIIADAGYRLVWVGLKEDNPQKDVRPVAHAGFDKGYLDNLGISWGYTHRGNGPVGRSIRDGITVVCNDVSHDPRLSLWRKEAEARGYASILSLPLAFGNDILGALAIYAAETDAFNDPWEVEIFQEMATDLAYGFKALRTRGERDKAFEKLSGAYDEIGGMVEKRNRQLETVWTRYENLVDFAPIGLFETDPDGNCLLVNRLWLEYSGMEKKQAIGNGWVRAIHPEDRQKVFEEWCAAVAQNQDFSFQYRFRSSEGRITWVLGSATTLFAENGEISGYLGAVQDITEIKAAERKLLKSEERLKQSQEIAKLGQWELDLVTNRLAWSPGIFHLFEIDPQVFRASYDAFLEVVHPEDREMVDRAYSDSLKTRTPYRSTHRLVMPDGRVKHVREACRHELDETGTPVRSVGIVQDITDIKRYQDSLQWELEINQAVARCLEELISSDQTIEHVTQAIFDSVKELTKSSHGFVASVDPETRIMTSHTLSTMLKGQCRVSEAQRRIHFKPAENGRFGSLFGHSVDTGQAFYTEAPASHPASKGLPEGHIPIRRFLSVPVVLAGKVRGLIALANSSLPYTEAHLAATSRFADIFGLALDRAEFQSALTRSEARFRALVETSTDWIWEVDRSGRYTYCSPGIRDILGYAPEEMLGKRFTELAQLDSQSRFKPMFSEIAKTGKSFLGLETEVRHKDGRLVILESGGVPIIDEDSNVIGYRGIDRDITGRKQAAEKLNRQKTMLQGILTAIQECAFLMDTEGRVLYANQTMAERLGTTVETLVGSEILGFIPGDLRQSRMKHVERVIRRKNPVQFEDVQFGRHIENRIYPLRHPETGEVTEMAYLGIDISERKQAELQLRKLSRAIEQSPSSIVITDTEGTIEYVNPAFTVITGYTPEEALGQNPRILKSEVHDMAFYRDMWETIRSGSIWNGELCNRKKDGSLFWEQTAISGVSATDGAVTHYIAVKHDISDRKDLEKLKEDVERIMRHDLKTPLNAIMGIPQILEMDDNLTEKQLEMIKMIETSGQRMLGMINMSMDIFKMETGSYRYSPFPVDAATVIMRIINENKSLISSKDIRVDFENRFEGQEMRVLSEKSLLFSMLSNLVVNALEASPPVETVRITLEGAETDGDIRISIHNHGAVPEAIRNDFFQKYKTHGKKKGTGLGTYSAKLIADTMGCRLDMATSEEDGTTLTVVLPRT